MKNQNHRKYLVEPIKSPSPDVRNRNYLKDTRAPLEQIEKYQLARSRDQSPRISSSHVFNVSFSEIDKLKNQISSLREQLRIMRANQIQYRNTKEKNNILQQEVSYLKAQLEKNKNYFDSYSHENFTLQRPGFNQNQKILREFNERVEKMNDENKRLISKLKEQTSKSENLINQNQKLKNQINSLKNQVKIPSGISKDQVQKVHNQLLAISENMQKEFQEHIQQRINQLEFKIEKNTNIQNVLLEKLTKSKIQSTRAHISTPKQEYSTGSNQKPKKYSDSIREEDQSHPSESKQSQNKLKAQNIKLNDQIILLNKQIDRLRDNCRDKQREISLLQQRIRLMNLNNEKKDSNYRSQAITSKQSGVSTGNQSLVLLKERIIFLQSDLKNKLNKINILQEQSSLKQKECTNLKQRLDEANYRLQTQIANYQQIADDQKRNQQRLQQQNNMYINKINELQSVKGSDLQFKQQLSKVPKLINDMKSLEQEMHRRGDMLSNALRQYVLLIQQIKSTLTSPKVEKIISNTNILQQSYINIQNLKEQSINLVGQLRKKLLLKEEKILQVEKDNKMLLAQVELLKQQQIQLKNVIEQYSAPQIKLMNKQSRKKTNIGLSLKQCIEEAMSGINKLESDVNAKLVQINEIRER